MGDATFVRIRFDETVITSRLGWQMGSNVQRELFINILFINQRVKIGNLWERRKRREWQEGEQEKDRLSVRCDLPPWAPRSSLKTATPSNTLYE